jgi:hypothetical protein
MPTVASVYGMLILFFYNDHAPPHFHVRAPDFRAKVELPSLTIIEVRGTMRARDAARLRAWAALHRGELLANWRAARDGEPLRRIGEP